MSGKVTAAGLILLVMTVAVAIPGSGLTGSTEAASRGQPGPELRAPDHGSGHGHGSHQGNISAEECRQKLVEKFGRRIAEIMWRHISRFPDLWCRPLPPKTPAPAPNTPTPIFDVTPTPTPESAPTPTPTPELTPAPTPEPTPAPTPTPSPSPDPTPTPAPTPTPTTPAPGSDLRIVSVSVTSPLSAAAGTSFTVNGNANLINDGPVDNVPAAITFTLGGAPGCTFNRSPVVVSHSGMPLGVDVFAARRWTVSCSTQGDQQFTLTVSVAPTGAYAGTDPDLSNNSGTASDTTIVP